MLKTVFLVVAFFLSVSQVAHAGDHCIIDPTKPDETDINNGVDINRVWENHANKNWVMDIVNIARFPSIPNTWVSTFVDLNGTSHKHRGLITIDSVNKTMTVREGEGSNEQIWTGPLVIQGGHKWFSKTNLGNDPMFNGYFCIVMQP